MDEFVGIPSLNAKLPLTDGMILLRESPHHLSIEDLEKKATTATTVCTSR
jgi:hypothetical protein